MAEPVMQSPLHHLGLAAQSKPVDASRGAWANEVPLQGYVSLRGDSANSQFIEAASRALGAPLPTSPCTVSAAGKTTILWLSSDEWMVVCPREATASLTRGLEQELAAVRNQVADNSGGYTQILLTGRDAARVLSHCTVYNLDKLTEGRVVGTTFGRTFVYLRREGDGFNILARRSFADYTWKYLERAAAPYGFGIANVAQSTPGRAA